LDSQRRTIAGSLYIQVLVAVAAGILLGYLAPDVAVHMKPLGDGFIKLIKMLIGPVIFCTVVNGIAGMESLKHVGRTGILALVYFEVVSTFALILGLIVVNVVKPGVGMNVDVAALDAHQIEAYTQAAQHQSVVEFLLDVIPNTLIDAFAKGEILQVLLVAVLFGFALHSVGERAQLVRDFVDRLGQVLFAIVGIVMRLAPIGAFGAMAATIGKYGAGTLVSLAKLMACFYFTCLVFIFVVLGLIARYHGFSILRFVRFIRDELLIVLGTSSSESVLPRMISKLEHAGCAKSVVGLVIPTGYSFNLDGTSIYLTMAAIFIAQATNTPLTLMHQVTLLIVLLLTSKGAAAVTGSGFIVLAATLSTVGTLPATALVLILGIDRFMSEARALTNLVGNGVATVVVSKWCNALDEPRFDQVVGGMHSSAS
jgi:aerobic C4-dicarboxylate transport protein